MERRPNAMPDDDVTKIHDTRGGDPPRHHHPRADDGDAFLPDPFGDSGDAGQIKGRPRDDDAPTDFGDELAEEFLNAATGNIDMGEQQLDQVSPTETGGPFTISSDEEEFAEGYDGNNPPGATREPFPTAMREGSVPTDSTG